MVDFAIGIRLLAEGSSAQVAVFEPASSQSAPQRPSAEAAGAAASVGYPVEVAVFEPACFVSERASIRK